MSVTCGFYNSLNGDRKYDSVLISKMFDGLIIDGVFASIGTCFVAQATTGVVVNVGIGKAWFKHSWLENDAILPMTADASEVLLDRIDALVMEFNADEAVRSNTIKFVKGTPSSTPTNPVLQAANDVYQYPICYIYRAAGSTAITQANITNMIGTTTTPFVTGILQTVNLDTLLGQWEDELDQFIDTEEDAFNDWFDEMKADLLAEQALLDTWIASEQADFTTWFNNVKNQLGSDAAGNLQNEIDREEINRILVSGFVDGTKTFSTDGTVITAEASDGGTLVKTFSNGFLTVTSVLKSANDIEIATMVKTFNASGTLITTVVTYV